MRFVLAFGVLAGAGLCQGCLFPSFDPLTRCEQGCGGAMDVSSSSGGVEASSSASEGGGGASEGGGGAGGGGGGASEGGGGGAGEGGSMAARCADPLGRGADGVLVEPPDEGQPPFCIDAVEVSFARYTDFLVAVSSIPAGDLAPLLGAECADIPLTLDRDGLLRYYATYQAYSDPVFPHRELPAIGMTWCEARMHCRWAGKELCGNLDGAGAEGSDWRSSRWVAACSNNDEYVYSYRSDAPDASMCKVDGCAEAGGYQALDPAAENPRCEGGVEGLYNMSGNAYEWVDNCVDRGTPDVFDDDECFPRGGACELGTEYTYCAYPGQPHARGMGYEFVGLRCCWDAP
ncbi:formylglycine-generating enzyme family protein [Sorangium sp. So ce1151]|uniref:formylglycine-generating enzyme family protein n=1 Tax=Sorangium sp. So ce1151 TaxID=3133332 RepID=UPI003F608262